MVFVQLLGLASCSFCMFNSLILSISLSFSVFFFILRQFGQLLCFASCKLSFLSLFLCCLCSSLSFYFFLFLYLSLLFFRSLHCSLWPAHISFSTFLSLYSIIRVASARNLLTAIFVFLSFSVYISISLLVLSLSVKLYSRREHSVQENYKCLRKGALEKFSTLLLDFFVIQWQDPDGRISVYCCPGDDRIRMVGYLFVCCPGDERIRMAGSLFAADVAMTGSGWQDICLSADVAMTGSGWQYLCLLLSWRWQDPDGSISVYCCPSDDRIRMAGSLFTAVLVTVPRIRGQDNFAKFIPREGERELAGKQLWQVYK